ncbi:phytoene desaturase [Arcticibacter tournemirensis]|uniref:Phytoene desaturase n=1 Tax=Arcticibacter tournemirensis TaxID=699437 RepID=A0A5M9H6P6_9SPHI|nr:phytoene desaturase family protein [Arcticibacter tournemirensis]KAA8482546.1 phytoene desaturase [Arcticibacter tournemirensis]TQM52513.1 phytoene desaturase [Arcticibacter tournemirensis]
MKSSKIAIIGSGFAGLAAAALLAAEGHDVTIYEKNEQPGGRARVWQKDGFRFDMGPSWYWMPDVFENFFNLFKHKTSDFYELKRIDPSYRIYWNKNDYNDIPAGIPQLKEMFEQLEPGSAANLDIFLKQAGYKYSTGMGDFVFRPSNSVKEYMDIRLLTASFKLQMFSSIRAHVKKYFNNPRIVKLLEFPVLFLGGTAKNTPALYSMMNYADLALGTWYPMGGMNEIVKAMVAVAEEQGVRIKLNSEIKEIKVIDNKASSVVTETESFDVDMVISNADYEHTDQTLLETKYQNYSAAYWDKRVLSPSSLLFFIGTNKKVEGIKHHNLFFDEDFEKHSEEIYKEPAWPQKPLFYVCCPSKTDPHVAPPGAENLFFLIPVASGLTDTPEIREKYFNMIMERFKTITGQDIRPSIVVNRSYAINDFIEDYHSFKGNAYGLANTLLQTAFLKPKLRSKKVENLLYTGQLTVPGPGVPPAIISGQVAAREAIKYLQSTT